MRQHRASLRYSAARSTGCRWRSRDWFYPSDWVPDVCLFGLHRFSADFCVCELRTTLLRALVLDQFAVYLQHDDKDRTLDEYRDEIPALRDR